MTAVPLSDEQLAARIAEVIRPRMLIGLQDAELHDAPGTERINEWADSIANWAAEVVRAELATARAQVAAVRDLIPEHREDDTAASWIPPRQVRAALDQPTARES